LGKLDLWGLHGPRAVILRILLLHRT
jgi:hypothetical protein